MGKRGPKRTPTLILRQRGSWLAGTRAGEPQFASGAPEPMGELDMEARRVWDRLLPMLLERGVVTRADGLALTCLCRAWSRFAAAEALLAKDGLTTTTALGGIKPHPAVAISNAAWAQIVKGCAMFGINPADRSSVTPAGPPAYDDDAMADAGAALMEEIRRKQQKGKKRGKRSA